MKKLIAAAVAGMLTTGAVSAQETLEMTSAFGKNLPILGTAATDFVDNINGISSEVEFEHFDPGELVSRRSKPSTPFPTASVDAAYHDRRILAGQDAGCGVAFRCRTVRPGSPARCLAWMIYDDGAHSTTRRCTTTTAITTLHVIPCGMICARDLRLVQGGDHLA